MRTNSHHRYYRPGLPIPAECRVFVREVIDALTLEKDRSEVLHLVHKQAREALMDHVARTRVTITEMPGMYSTEFRLDVLVFDPLQFEEIVQAEVHRRLGMMRSPQIMEGQ